MNRVSAIQMYNQAEAAAKEAGADLQKKQLAYQLFSSSTIADDTFAAGWFQLGNANGDMKLNAASAACYRRVLELPFGEAAGDLTPEVHGWAMVNLAHRLYWLGQFDEAYEMGVKAVAKYPHLAAGWCNLSLIQATFGDHQEAIQYAQKAYDMDPLPAHEVALAFALLFDRQWAKGLKHFEARYPYQLKHFLSYPYPQWHGEPDKKVFLSADQGLGDTLSYARFVEAAALRAKFIYMMVQPQLLTLFRAAFQHLTNVNVFPMPAPWPPADVWTTFVSLPVALGLTDQEIENTPQITIPGFQTNPVWKVPNKKFHVGVAWAGSTQNEIDQFRSFPITHFLELSRIPGVQLYSLQADGKARDIHDHGAASLIRDLCHEINGDVATTTAIIGHLDLVITVESALGHIAGACGKECWIPYSYRGRDYRLGWDGKNPLWYPRHRIFKQDPSCKWEPVFERITDALMRRVKLLDQEKAA